MKYSIIVPRGSELWSFTLLSNDHEKIVLENVFVLDVHKWHNHRYNFYAFFYSSHRIFASSDFRSKKELVGAIKKLLQKELYVDVQ